EAVFRGRPTLRRHDAALPAHVLRDIERHTLLVDARASALLEARRHLKRGLLLYGPPGTGKTHTVRWITAELADTTVIVLSGGSLGAVGPVCRLARELAPSLLVLEDVDPVAGERRRRGHGGPLLFELLNELDGMADDANVAVVLTSNRPELLEPALAARPGRVDLAVEIPLPDADCRQRLFDLYARGMTLELDDGDAVIRRTAGVTASFFRELLRQALLDAADHDSGVVRDEHLAAGLDRLLSTDRRRYRARGEAARQGGHREPSRRLRRHQEDGAVRRVGHRDHRRADRHEERAAQQLPGLPGVPRQRRADRAPPHAPSLRTLP